MKKLWLIHICLFLFISNIFGICIEKDTVLTTAVQFEINTDNIVNKDAGYEYLQSNMIPFMENYIDCLDRVEFIDSSSPDGPEKFNRKLSKLRAEKLIEDIQVPANKKYIQYVGENYNLLLNIVNDSVKDTLQNILIYSNNIKSDLHKLKLDTLYHQIRCVEVKMFFKGENSLRIGDCENDTILITDTAYLDTIYKTEFDTVYKSDTIPFKRIPIVAVKTNALADLLVLPTVSIEIYTYLVGLSVEFEYTFPWFKSDKSHIYYQIQYGTVGLRKYINNEYYGHYVGIYGSTMMYDICLNPKNGYQGEGWAVGITYGYVFRHKKYQRFKFEPYIRIGYMTSKFDKYYTSDPFDGKYYYDWVGRASDFVPRRFKLNYFGPTMIGFNLTFDLICETKY